MVVYIFRVLVCELVVPLQLMRPIHLDASSILAPSTIACASALTLADASYSVDPGYTMQCYYLQPKRRQDDQRDRNALRSVDVKNPFPVLVAVQYVFAIVSSFYFLIIHF